MKTEEMYSSILGERMHYKKLDNGLEIFIIPKPGYTKKYAIFGTNYGSIDNKFKLVNEDRIVEVPEGIAHFLEHKLFESEEGGVFNKFSKLGSSVNAYTNFNSTCYLFSCTDRFYENLSILIDFVQSPYLTDENVEKEKGIIEQEIRMYEDNPQWKVFFNGLRCLYKNHPVKIDIAGTVESIRKITKEDLLTCYNSFYVPKNMTVFIVGDVDIDRTIKEIEKNLKDEYKNTKTQVERILPKEPEEIVKSKWVENLSVSIPLFNIAFKDIDTNLENRDLLKKDIEIKLLLDMVFGRSSRLFRDLYDKGLINDNFEHEYTFDKSYGHSIIGGESKDPDKVYEYVIEEIKRLKEEGLSKEDFERIKRKSIGEHLSAFNSVEFIANTFTAYYFRGINLLDYIEILNEIKYDDIVQRFEKHFDLDRSIISIVKPH